jgi:hypothetical protein
MTLLNSWNIILTPFVGFFAFLAISYFIYRMGDVMAPKLKSQGAKLSQYACGEEFEAKKVQVGYKLFFYAALFFTMMHVAALVIATIPGGNIVYAIMGFFYIAMIGLSVGALLLK